MKPIAFMRKTLAALLALALLSVPALAAGEEPAPRAGGAVSTEDTVCGSPAYKVWDLMGSGEDYEWFDYAVPEGGVAALIFFNPVCGKSQALFRGLSLLTGDPRINVVPVTQAGRAEAQGFADTYIQGNTEHVYYNEISYQNPYDAYMGLLGAAGGTAFVVLVTEAGGVRTIRWFGTDVSSAQAVKAQADAILGASQPEEPEPPEEPDPSGLIDTIAGQEPYARVGRLWGGDGSYEPFDYTVPEGGAAALVFFKYGCGNCANLLRGLSLLTEDPRVNVVAVSLEDAAQAAAAAGAYGLAGLVDEVYYAPSNNPAGFYAQLLYGRGSFGTAFVILAEEVNGVKYIRWSGMSVRDAGTVKAQADAILGALEPEEPETPASAVLRDLERAGGSISFEVQAANRSAGALSGRLYAAGYAGGRLTDLRSAALELPANGRANERFSLRGETAKLFYLDGAGLRPLMEAAAA